MPKNRVIFVPNKVGMAELRSWEGPIGRNMDRRIRTLEYRGRTTAGKDTGALVESISSTRERDVKGNLESKVGTNPKKGGRRGYSLINHEGSIAHRITPRRPGGTLRFVVAGKVVFARSVWHPGTRGTHFLTRWLREVVK